MRLIFALSLCFSFVFAKINLAVTIIPQYSILKDITKDRANILLVIDSLSDPHSYEPKPSLISALLKTELYFAIGASFEQKWLKKFQNINPNMKIVDTSQGVQKLANLNPHIWTTPKNIKIIATNIYNALIKIDPKNQEFYKQNLQILLNRANKIDQQIKKILSSCKDRCKFISQHPAWSYFAKEYNLVEIVIEKDEKEPKIRDIIKLIKLAKKRNIHLILTQPELPDKSAKLIAKELNAKLVKISPLDKNWDLNLINLAKIIANE